MLRLGLLEARARALEPKLLATPSLALQAATSVLADMTRRAWTMASVVLNACLGKASVGPEAIEAAEREREIHASVRKLARDVWSGSQARARESFAVLSVFSCLRDISRHLGNIAVRVPSFR